MRNRLWYGTGALALSAALAATASGQNQAPIVFTAGVALTGSRASLGVPEEKAFRLLEKRVNAAGGIGGRPVRFNVLDTATDPQKAVLNVRKGILEDRAVGIICCTTTPESMAVIDTATRARVPLISMAASTPIVQPVAERFWVFKTPPADSVMVRAQVADMKRRGFKRVAFLGFADAYGDSGLKELQKLAPANGIEVVAVEKFAATDNDASAQAARIAAARPDAVLVWATPPGANTAHKSVLDAGYKGPIYQSYGVTNASFLQLGGKGVEGAIISGLPIVVYDQLPASLPNKAQLDEFVKAYRAEYNNEMPNSFAGHAWDAGTIFIEATRRALAAGRDPAQLEAFRAAVRDQIENLRGFRGISGVFNFSKFDHVGLGPSTANMITVQDGKFRLLKR